MYLCMNSHKIPDAMPPNIRINKTHIISALEYGMGVCVSCELVLIMIKEANKPKKRASGPSTMPVMEGEREEKVVWCQMLCVLLAWLFGKVLFKISKSVGHLLLVITSALGQPLSN